MSLSFAALFAAGLASLAAATTTPTTGPSGNPIYRPNVGEIVPVGKPYAVTWGPSCAGTVSLVLLRGPSANVVPLATIVDKIPNSGTYSWTPAATLEDDVTHYGLQIICDESGVFQYSTQFGISNPTVPKASSSSSVYGSVSASVSTGSSMASGSASYGSASAMSTASMPSSMTAAYPTFSTKNSTVVMTASTMKTPIVASTGFAYTNSSVIQPTVPMTVPSTLFASATSTPTSSGSASATSNAAVAVGVIGSSFAGLLGFAGVAALLL